MPDRSTGSRSPRAESRGDWRAAVREKLAPLRLPPEREVDIVEEVAQHLDDRYREACAAGLAESDAQARAWRELEEEDVLGRGVAAIERRRPLDLPPPGAPSHGRRLLALWQDVRYALRALRQQPAFTATVLVALALAIGPTTAIVSIGNWLRWRPVAGVSAPHELDVAWFGRWRDTPNGTSFSPASVSSLNLADFKSHLTTVAGITGVQETQGSVVTESGVPRLRGVAQVSGDFFQVLGVRLAAGRAFTPDEDRPPLGAPIVVVSHVFAVSAFGSPSLAIDRRLTINHQPFRIVGVAAPGFRGVLTMSRTDVWMTGATMPYYFGYGADSSMAQSNATRTNGPFYEFIARRKPGVTTAQYRDEIIRLSAQLADWYPEANDKFRQASPRVFPGLNMPPMQRARLQTMVRILLAVGGVLLLLGCANAANMMIARAIRREHESAIRKALGAGRGRLIQLQLCEACLLAAGGAVLGLGMALILKQVMQGLLFPAPTGMLDAVPVDWRVVGVMIGAAFTVGIAAGAAPAWLIARSRATGAILRAGGSRAASRVPRLRSGLAVLQLALSLTLMIGALLLLTTLRNLRAVDLGFNPEHLATFRVEFNRTRYPQASVLAYEHDLLSALGTSPDVMATFGEPVPFSYSNSLDVVPPGGDPSVPLRVVTGGVAHNYFATLGTPILRGRGFTEDEAFATGPVEDAPILINETLARRLFGEVDPIGRTVHLAGSSPAAGRDLPVVGVVGDVHASGITREPDPALYQPLGRYAGNWRSTILVRSHRPLSAIAADARAAGARIDPALPLSDGDLLSDAIDRNINEQRLFANVLSWLGAIAFVLAAVGLYGLVAQTTSERTREFGIRLAIGATRGHIARLVARYAVSVGVLGTGGGLVLAAYATRFIQSLLFGVTPLDPLTYIGSVGLLAVVLITACAWPAIRASRVEPVEVLRAE